MKRIGTYILIALIVLLAEPFSAAAIDVEITAIVAGCGDGIVGSGEQCDLSDFDGASCTTQGFRAGTLSCTSICTFNTTQCITGGGNANAAGGGVSQGVGTPSTPGTHVVFVGRAYPNSVVTLLKDAQIAATTIADKSANFQMTLSGITGGNYIFSMYSEDARGVRSALLAFPINVTPGVATKVSKILIAPTISADRSEVRKGDDIAFYGQSVRGSEVAISINTIGELLLTRTTDETGAYVLNLNTAALGAGRYLAKPKSILGGEATPFGMAVGFTVGERNLVSASPLRASPPRLGDVNRDERVNLVDLSVMAYWHRKDNPPASHDLNSDGKVDLVDFSIIAFHWTG